MYCFRGFNILVKGKSFMYSLFCGRGGEVFYGVVCISTVNFVY